MAKKADYSQLLAELEDARAKLSLEVEQYRKGKHHDYNRVLEASRKLDELILQYLEVSEEVKVRP